MSQMPTVCIVCGGDVKRPPEYHLYQCQKCGKRYDWHGQPVEDMTDHDTAPGPMSGDTAIRFGLAMSDVVRRDMSVHIYDTGAGTWACILYHFEIEVEVEASTHIEALERALAKLEAINDRE